MDKQDKMLAEEAETVFADLLESAIVDVASEAHRAARLGMDPRLNIEEEEEYQLAMQARISVGDSNISGSKKSKHGVDIFGQTHPAVASEVFECMNCNRNIMAGRFAPHLEKCMGKGRRARAKATSNTKSEPQRKKQTFQKGGATKLASSNIQELQKNGPDVNGGTADDSDEVNNKVAKKRPKQVRKEASKRPSRSSARQS